MIRPMAIALAAIVAVAATAAQTAGDISVVDGHTVKVDGAPWRLQGFDTPETFYARCDAERRLADLATRELARLFAAAKKVEPPWCDDARSGRSRCNARQWAYRRADTRR
jgi:endonuclease YncB( thermonuclease family)